MPPTWDAVGASGPWAERLQLLGSGPEREPTRRVGINRAADSQGLGTVPTSCSHWEHQHLQRWHAGASGCTYRRAHSLCLDSERRGLVERKTGYEAPCIPGFLRLGNVPGEADIEHWPLCICCEDRWMDQRLNLWGDETLVGVPALASSISGRKLIWNTLVPNSAPGDPNFKGSNM